MKTENDYAGYLNIGGDNKQEAESKIGIQLFKRNKPSKFKRVMLLWLLGIYWVDTH